MIGKKRSEVRRTLLIYLKCVDSNTGDEIGKIVDITAGGFLLISGSPPEAGDELSCTIRLPSYADFTDKEINAAAVCRWSRAAETPSYFYSGISFKTDDQPREQLISALVDLFGFSNGQRRIVTEGGDIGYK